MALTIAIARLVMLVVTKHLANKLDREGKTLREDGRMTTVSE